MNLEFRFVTVCEVYEPERDTFGLHVLKTPHKKSDSARFFLSWFIVQKELT